MNSKIIEANRRVHSSLLLSGEYQKSPHRSMESVRRVQTVLSELHVIGERPLHLDIGCGDGFIFECAPKHWNKHGIDSTPEMLQACGLNHPEVKLQLGLAEKLPFNDASFDIVTCYSFLDHLESTNRFYVEAIRILKPGGIFYFGLSPNSEYYAALLSAKEFKLSKVLTDQVDLKLEFLKAFDDGSYYEANFGIDKKELSMCEPGKSITNGLTPNVEKSKLKRLNVTKIEVNYEWIFQQNRLEATKVNNLIDFLPFTSACFKYFDLIGIK
jgi:SAM-dependent methyltransferase